MVDESQRAERHDLGIYRSAINMCVVWYRIEKETGKMQDVYANASLRKRKAPKRHRWKSASIVRTPESQNVQSEGYVQN
jgi:hypothetical protein